MAPNVKTSKAKKEKRQKGLHTRAVHDGTKVDPASGGVGLPIHWMTTFHYPRHKDATGEWVNNPWLYSRWGSPTVTALESKVASLEGAEASVAFSSGMGAITTCLLAHVRSGQKIVTMDMIYGETHKFLKENAPGLGIQTTFVDSSNADDILRQVDAKTKLVYVEIPTNPHNRCIDLDALTKGLEDRFGEKRPLVFVDATISSPANFQPLAHGADISIHSATKYLNGHSDLLAGVASGSQQVMEPVSELRKSLGAMIDPMQAWLLARSMRTFPARIARHNANGEAVAQFLSQHPKVEKVWHLSRPDHPDHAVAKRLLNGYGALIAFKIGSDRPEHAHAFLETLEVFHPATSLGSIESLATIPRETTHPHLSDAEAKRRGLDYSFLRIAVGIEDTEDLIEDLDRALTAIPKPVVAASRQR